MTVDYKTRHFECVLVVTVIANKPMTVHLIVEDPALLIPGDTGSGCILYDRLRDIKERDENGEFSHVFYVRLPVCGKVTRVRVFDEEKGESENDDSFEFKVERAELEKHREIRDILDRHMGKFMVFAIQFAYNARNLPVNTKYTDRSGFFAISYLPSIVDNAGNELNTPMRVSIDNGLIEVSQKFCRTKTFPRILILLLHEYSHFYANRDMNDEVEADLNAVIVYLATGFPRTEASEAFLDTFENADTQQNIDRHKLIIQTINDFDSNQILYA